MSQSEGAPHNGKHIVLYGLVGIGNTGNDATLGVALNELRALLPSARFSVLGCDVALAEEAFGVPAAAIQTEAFADAGTPGARLPGPFGKLAREIERWSSAFKLMREADCLMVAGTGVFDDYATPSMVFPYRLWRWCQAARMAGTPVKFISIGAGPIERRLSKFFFRGAARAADSRSYRDEASKAFVAKMMGLDVARDDVVPDLVFALDAAAPPPRETVKTVGVGVMDYHTWRGAKGTSDDVYTRYMDLLTQFCTGLLDRGLEVRILTGEPSDQPAADDLSARLVMQRPASQAAVSIATIRTLQDVCAAIGGTDVVVATRYHNIVSALICSRPVVSISYTYKNQAAMSDFGVGAYAQNIWDFDLDTLNAHFAAVTVDVGGLSRRLAAVAAGRRTAVREHFKAVVASPSLR